MGNFLKTRMGFGIFLLALLSFMPVSSVSGMRQFSFSLGNSSHPLAAVAQQATSYPVVTNTNPTGYPAQSTATSGSGYPVRTSTTAIQRTATPSYATQVTSTRPFSLSQTTTVYSTVPGSNSSTTQSNLFLTENAEMGQSSATVLPSETATGTPTLKAKATPTAALASNSQPFKMNWLGFGIGLIAVLAVGGSVGWYFLHRQKPDLQL